MTVAAEELREIMARPEQVDEPVVLPEPEVRSRPAKKSEIPGGAMTVAKKAIAAGFVVKATYARGPRVDQYWKFIEHSDSVVLRGSHPDGRKFIAAWVGKTGVRGSKAGVTETKFEFAYCHGVIGRCNATALSAYLVANH